MEKRISLIERLCYHSGRWKYSPGSEASTVFTLLNIGLRRWTTVTLLRRVLHVVLTHYNQRGHLKKAFAWEGRCSRSHKRTATYLRVILLRWGLLIAWLRRVSTPIAEGIKYISSIPGRDCKREDGPNEVRLEEGNDAAATEHHGANLPVRRVLRPSLVIALVRHLDVTE